MTSSPYAAALAAIGGPGVVAIFRAATPDGVVEACKALRDSGIGAVEITLTTPGAVRLIEDLRAELGDSLAVGAGTVLDVAACGEVIDAGASFVVLPGLDAGVVEECVRRDVLCVPGALTPTEVLAASRAGAGVVKLFPARVATPAYVADLLGPFPDMRMMPTGGIDATTAAEFVRRGVFAVGVGGRLVEPRAVREGDLASIATAATDLLRAVADARAAR